MFSGVAHWAYAWHTRRRGGLLWGVLLAVTYIAAGGCVLLHPVAGLTFLTLVLVAYLLLESAVEFILSYQLRPLGGSTGLLVDGVVTFMLVVVIWWTWPASAVWVVGTLVGVSMLFSGVARLTVSLSARQMAKAFRSFRVFNG
jgi:uncharacterized membrane protein HdeD (DUF308 family)